MRLRMPMQEFYITVISKHAVLSRRCLHSLLGKEGNLSAMPNPTIEDDNLL